MCVHPVKVLFVCKSCHKSFPKVSTFIEHKKKYHFNEYQSITCIVFDERACDPDPDQNLELLGHGILNSKSIFEDDSGDSISATASPIDINNPSKSSSLVVIKEEMHFPLTPFGFEIEDVDLLNSDDPNQNQYQHQQCESLPPMPVLIPSVHVLSADADPRSSSQKIGQCNIITKQSGSGETETNFDPFANVKCELELDEYELGDDNNYNSSSSRTATTATGVPYANNPSNKTDWSLTISNINENELCNSDSFVHPFLSVATPSKKTNRVNQHQRNTNDKKAVVMAKSKSGISDSDNESDDEDEDESEPVTLSDWLKIQKEKKQISSPNLLHVNKSEPQHQPQHQPQPLDLLKIEGSSNVTVTGSEYTESDNDNHQQDNNNSGPFVCGVCGHTSRVEYGLVQHLKTHTEVLRPFICPHSNCAKTFAKKINLRHHLQGVHAEDRPYRCPRPECGKAFKNSKGVSKHMSVHSTARPYECKEPNCSSAFTRSYHLTEHMKRVHWGKTQDPFQNKQNKAALVLQKLFQPKRLKCDSCNKSFVLGSDLQRHSLVHTEDRPFRCETAGCGSAFKDKYVLLRHVRTVHSVGSNLSLEDRGIETS